MVNRLLMLVFLLLTLGLTGSMRRPFGMTAENIRPAAELASFYAGEIAPEARNDWRRCSSDNSIVLLKAMLAE